MQTVPYAFTIPEACSMARLSRTSIYRAIRDGELQARKRGGRTLVLDRDLIAFLENLPPVEAK